MKKFLNLLLAILLSVGMLFPGVPNTHAEEEPLNHSLNGEDNNNGQRYDNQENINVNDLDPEMNNGSPAVTEDPSEEPEGFSQTRDSSISNDNLSEKIKQEIYDEYFSVERPFHHEIFQYSEDYNWKISDGELKVSDTRMDSLISQSGCSRTIIVDQNVSLRDCFRLRKFLR